MKLSSRSVAVAVLFFMLGGIGLSSALNLWQTESTKTPATFQQGAFTGQSNPADIRGSYKLSDITRSFPIKPEDLSTAFGFTGNLTEIKVKDLEQRYADLKAQGTEIGTASMRLFVALYCGLPYDLTEEVYLPQHAVTILKNKGHLTQDQLLYVEKHTANITR